MRVKEEKLIAEEIWDGKPEVLGRAYKEYLLDPQGKFVEWVSALYSFRHLPECGKELRELYRWILKKTRYDIQLRTTRRVTAVASTKLANELDVLSTVLEWLSGIFFMEEARGEARQAAHLATEVGLSLVQNEPHGNHTRALLQLTRALCHFGKSDPELADSSVAQALQEAPAVADPNQRARIYRKAGALYLRLGKWRGWWYLAKALTVRGIAAGTRKKTLTFWRR